MSKNQADGFFQESSCYNGPTERQFKGFDYIVAMEDEDFREYVNGSKRCRIKI